MTADSGEAQQRWAARAATSAWRPMCAPWAKAAAAPSAPAGLAAAERLWRRYNPLTRTSPSASLWVIRYGLRY